MNNKFDIIVIGGGHAGLEAASVSARLGMRTALITISAKQLCKPSCNPNIGGTAKGHLVKEIDALGGIMGVLADNAGIQYKMLNKSKGPAIWSPRAQIDKDLYPIAALNHINSLEKITLIEQIVDEILVDKYNKAVGCRTNKNEYLFTKAIVLCAGTFLNGKMFTGQDITIGGRVGEPAVEKISDLLVANGLEKGRLKTGTPPRILNSSIDFSKLQIEAGDENPQPFSFQTKAVKNKIVCYGTNTNAQTHEILRTGFDKSPMFSGLISGIGPRYCPSIEDKINRFSERDSHKILLEPEGLSTNSIYVNGFSTSLPIDVQTAALHSISGLETCQILRPGYAIEYDFFFPHQLKFTLETKPIENLYFAGQINGTSGYEEAASQGLLAGINASLKIKGESPLFLMRSEAYIGVLIDDLVNKSTNEPYRMFTSLAEYRLLLRQDNANDRLTQYAHKLGLIPDWYFEQTYSRKQIVDSAFEECKNVKLKADIINDYLSEIAETPLIDSTSIYTLGKRAKVYTGELLKYIHDISGNLEKVKADENLAWKLDVELKYEGYIIRQKREVKYFLENENKRIPENFDYDAVNSLSTEARDKLKRIHPASIGQASRISGISATDIAVIAFFLRQQ